MTRERTKEAAFTITESNKSLKRLCGGQIFSVFELYPNASNLQIIFILISTHTSGKALVFVDIRYANAHNM